MPRLSIIAGMMAITLAAFVVIFGRNQAAYSQGGITSTCTSANPVVTITTLGKGQKPSVNTSVSHQITGNIIGGVEAYGRKADRIKVCSGTAVHVQLVGAFVPEGVEFLRGSMDCIDFRIEGATCDVASMTEKVIYVARSRDGADVDQITLIPVD